MDYYENECHCGEIIQIPADGERHSKECPKCGLTMFCDESGDILKSVEQVGKRPDKPTPTPMGLLAKVGSFRTYDDNRVSDSIQFKRLYAVVTALEGERDEYKALANLVPELVDLRGIDCDAVVIDEGFEKYICVACQTVLEDNWQPCPNPKCPRFKARELMDIETYYYARKRSEYDALQTNLTTCRRVLGEFLKTVAQGIGGIRNVEAARREIARLKARSDLFEKLVGALRKKLDAICYKCPERDICDNGITIEDSTEIECDEHILEYQLLAEAQALLKKKPDEEAGDE